ncbi:hypothetical protein C8F01DRAFT_699273 [Mycena amicta]|nr:hypothetical protein C8F01DRAFT_699273 [Mycena amicta]
MYSHIPRAHAFAYRTPAYIDDFPPWAPALFPQPQTLPTDVVSLDAASSLWIEPEREESCYGSEEFSLSFSQLGIPWLNDTITPAFDATLLAALASDAQLLYCPEQAFADICWAAAVHDVDGDASANLPTPGRRSPTVPDAHPPLADVTNTNTRVEPEPEPPRPVSCALDDEEDDSEDADADADTITPRPTVHRLDKLGSSRRRRAQPSPRRPLCRL